MTSTTSLSKAERRRLKAAEQEAARRRAERRRQLIRGGVIALATLVVVAIVVLLATRGDDAGGEAPASAPTVGGDLHTVTSIESALFVGGHAAVAVSHDDGQSWQQVDSLEGADAMGWAVTPDAVLVGGHPGLFRSTDDGATFSQVSDVSFTDVHALGGTGTTVYLASPQAGLLASIDGGESWEVRNAEAGRSFMGTILVDPRDPQRLIAPDMAGALAVSTDGGTSWQSLGGPKGAMTADWNPTNTEQIVAVGMDGAARTTDGGATWQDLDVPNGTSAIAYTDNSNCHAWVQERQASTLPNRQAGRSWSTTARPSSPRSCKRNRPSHTGPSTTASRGPPRPPEELPSSSSDARRATEPRDATSGQQGAGHVDTRCQSSRPLTSVGRPLGSAQ